MRLGDTIRLLVIMGSPTMGLCHCASDQPLASCLVTIEHDWGLDNRINERMVDGYDDIGNRVVHDWEYYGDLSGELCDTGRQGTGECVPLPIAERTTYEYDQNGNTLAEKIDEGRDGTVEHGSSWRYDQEGRQTRYEANHDDDDTIEIVDTFAYDQHGNLIHYSRASLTDDGTYSTQVSLWVLTYDLEGRVLTSRFDEGSRGRFSRCTVNTYDEGRLAAMDVDLNCDGSSTFRYRYTYDDTGRMTAKDYDAGTDGLVDERWLWAFDDEGRETSFEHHIDGNGTVDSYKRSTYDPLGRLETVAAMDTHLMGTEIENVTRTSYRYFYDERSRVQRIDINSDPQLDDEIDIRVSYAYQGCD